MHLRRQIAVGLDGDQLTRRGQPAERLAQVLAHHATDRGRLRHDAFQRPVLLQPFHRSLGADLAHPGHVVDRIAHQREPVDDPLRRHPEFGQHTLAVQSLGRRIVAGHGVDQGHVIIDQLRHVLVAGAHHRAQPLAPGALTERADHIIGLDAFDHDERPAHSAHHAVDRRNLQRQIGRCRGSIRLVLVVEVVAKGAPGGVKHHSAKAGRHGQFALSAQPP